MTVEEPHNLGAALRQAANQRPAAPALSLEATTLSYAEVAGMTGALAAGLRDLGVGKGDRVAILFPNVPQFVVSYFATASMGGVAVPVNCLLQPPEVGYILQNSGANTLITLDVFRELLPALPQLAPGLQNVIVSGEPAEGCLGFEELIAAHQGQRADAEISGEELAVLIYTSGTTGRPKGAMLSHRNLLANGRACRQVIRVTGEDVFLGVLPLFHSFGATVCMVLPILCGAHTVLHPRFQALAIMESIEAKGVTFFPAVPAMFTLLLAMRSEQKFGLGSLRVCVSGGAALPLEVVRGFQERYGVTMVEGYGPTEASPVVSVNPPEGVIKPGSVGPPLPGVEVGIQAEDGTPLPTGEIGEVCVRGPNVMQGYWQDSEGSAEALRGGWLHTGDLGRVDEDGYLYIVDRLKDLIIVGGMNVYPGEVEDVIYQLPQVAEAAVVGMSSTLRGEDVCAFIALHEGTELSAEQIIRHCAGKLARFKTPARVEILPELPKSAIGKILKRELRKSLAEPLGTA